MVHGDEVFRLFNELPERQQRIDFVRVYIFNNSPATEACWDWIMTWKEVKHNSEPLAIIPLTLIILKVRTFPPDIIHDCVRGPVMFRDKQEKKSMGWAQ